GHVSAHRRRSIEARGLAMTWKDEFQMIWILCVVVIAFAVRHFLGGAMYLAEHVAAASVVCIPGVTHLLAGIWR
ncbi:MAG: hypothetical protein ACRD51_12545, partial [Candidatus Acidiferrum sp.]